MLRLTELKLPLDHDEPALRAAICARLGIGAEALLGYHIARRGHDARNRRRIRLVYTIDATVAADSAIAGTARATPTPDTAYHPVARLALPPVARPVVVGTGPCGLFAALILAQMGFAPIILERGKMVRERTQDTFAFWRRRVLNPESNVQFGEGGAGTFSDGKLYSQIRDPRHLARKVLAEMVAAGAPEEILVASKPHIGTFRLVTIVEQLRAQIIALGGSFHFASRVDALQTDAQHRLCALVLADGTRIATRHAVLAIGHSARDSFAMLACDGVALQAKPISIGVRIEHPQSLIDRCRFGDQAGNRLLGAADYRLVHHASNGRAVYSFCMCPGGTVVAAASEPGGVVTNGMSQYSRNERNANAGIVVGLTTEDYQSVPNAAAPGDPLAGIAFQRHWEAQAFIAGGGDYAAPAQRVGDFLAGRASTALGSVLPSYRPGVKMTDLAQCLPGFAVKAIREALPGFARQLAGFDMADALMTGVETRTSSPLRIPRGPDFQSLNTPGLFPAGEGAGYAGGILSAAIDGIEVAEAVARAMQG